MNTDLTRNASGCRDMTAYKAICNVSRDQTRNTIAKAKRPKVYICSPLAGDMEANVDKALGYCRFALDSGKLPIAPHCYLPRFMDDTDPMERELAISLGIRMLHECKEVWQFGTRISEGMQRELMAAKRRGIKVRRFSERMEEM